MRPTKDVKMQRSEKKSRTGCDQSRWQPQARGIGSHMTTSGSDTIVTSLCCETAA